MASGHPNEGPPGSFASFPKDPAEFDSDPRISFSKLDDKFILEAEDGQEYEYDTALKRWILTVRAHSFPFPGWSASCCDRLFMRGSMFAHIMEHLLLHGLGS